MAYSDKDKERAYQKEYYQANKSKRKSHTSNKVKLRHRTKTYKQYNINLRYDTDQTLIDKIEELKATGIGTTEAIRYNQNIPINIGSK